jgi:hypothetical protein
LTVFVDLIANLVFLVQTGKGTSVWDAFSGESLRHNGHPAIQRVAIDIIAASIEGVSDNPGTARALYSKIHLP